MNIRKWMAAVMAVAVMGFAGTAMAADEAPSATVHITETQVGLLLTGDWGHGTLKYKGKNHMFHMGGAKIGGIGVSKMDVNGSVYYLKKREDFAGVYFKADAGLTLAVGKSGSWLKNDKGVVIHLGADSEGLALQIGLEGLKISF